MKKRILCLILLAVMCFSFTACGSDHSVKVSKDKKTGEQVLIYNDKTYYPADIIGGTVLDRADRKLLDGGDYDFGFYYSYTYTEPMYLISVTNAEEGYVREDYSYKTDTFNVVDTDLNFVMEEVLVPNGTIKLDETKITDTTVCVQLLSKNCPYMYLEAYIYRQNGGWYMHIDGSENTSQELTPDFANTLFYKGIIH